MTDSDVVHIGLQAMLLSAKLGFPILLVALGIGFAVSLFQAATQVQEMTLSFVPKLVGGAVVLAVPAHWLLR